MDLGTDVIKLVKVSSNWCAVNPDWLMPVALLERPNKKEIWRNIKYENMRKSAFQNPTYINYLSHHAVSHIDSCPMNHFL